LNIPHFINPWSVYYCIYYGPTQGSTEQLNDRLLVKLPNDFIG
jgi:hypothetical protein